MKKEQMNKVNVENENARALTDKEATQATGSGTDYKIGGSYEFHLYTIPTEEEMKKQFEKKFNK